MTAISDISKTHFIYIGATKYRSIDYGDFIPMMMVIFTLLVLLLCIVIDDISSGNRVGIVLPEKNRGVECWVYFVRLMIMLLLLFPYKNETCLKAYHRSIILHPSI